MEGAVDDVGEVPFEHAENLQAAIAAGEQGACFRVVAGLSKGEAVQSGVELTVAYTAEPVACPVG